MNNTLVPANHIFPTRFCQTLMNFLKEKNFLQPQIQAGLTVSIQEFSSIGLPLKHSINCYNLPQRKAALMVRIAFYLGDRKIFYLKSGYMLNQIIQNKSAANV